MKTEFPRVLIVDDMPAVRSIIREMLQNFGFSSIEEAEDGEEAWQVIRDNASNAKGEQSYGLILTDWLMPGIEGVDLVRKIRAWEKTQHLLVLMITSQGQAGQWAEARAAGISGFVLKPFDEKQLREELRRCLRAGA